MSIDNLPAQLPKDSTEFFGDRLMPVLTSLVQEGLKSSIIQGATITSKSQLQAKHAWLKPHMTSNKKKVLILGSGFVAGPVARVLGSRNDVELVIGSNQEEEAKKLASLSQNGAAIEQFNVQNEERLRQIIDGSSIVISLLPATMHLPVAQACLGSRAHLVTASYISPQMQSLHQQYTKSLLNYRYCRAVDKKLVFLNEIGLDPGLDHLSAKKIIDEAHNSGHQVPNVIRII